jgi:hypothetical protein
MRLAVLAIVAPALAGCVIHTANDRDSSRGHPGELVGSISARWTFRNLADGVTTPCPAGFDTALLVSQAVDAGGAPTADPITDRFDCADGLGESTQLEVGSYQYHLEIRSDDLTQLYAQSLPATADIEEVLQPYAPTIFNDAGYVHLSWQLENLAGQPVDCGALLGGMPQVVLAGASADGQVMVNDGLTCEAGSGYSLPLLAGSYALAISAVDGGMTAGTAAPLQPVAISAANQVTELGVVTIPLMQ